ncbi:hypothetical protein Tco_1205030, partial [Tanacetum coccineum]
MNCYRPPPTHLAVLDLQLVPAVPVVLSPVPIVLSPVSVVTTSMSMSTQVAPVRYGWLSAMLSSLPVSC